MRYFDQNNKEIAESKVDFNKGYTKVHSVFKMCHDAVPEVVEVTKVVPATVYPEQGHEGIPYTDFRGDLSKVFGVESETIIVTEYQAPIDAWDEYEDVAIYVPYTQAELDEREIASIKTYLTDTDYIGVRIAEGDKTVDDYKEIISKRKAQRERMRELTAKLNKQTKEKGKKNVSV